jgi:hypothetical protein
MPSDPDEIAKLPVDKWKNLYREKDGRPKLRRSVVAFIDLLGYRSAVVRAHAEGRQHEFLLKLRTALTESLSRLRDIVPGHRAPWRVKAFTDNIVLCFPMLSGEDEAGTLPIAIDRLGSFQLYMTIDGFFIRGGVAVADVYFDEEIVFGPGLLEAYATESQRARDPRIVLADSCLQYIAESSSCSLLKDADGQLFVNYLNKIIWYDVYDEQEGRTPAPGVDFLTQHKRLVEAKLHEYAAEPAVWSKYHWVARYHNFFCKDCGPSLPLRYRVVDQDAAFEPQRIRKQEGSEK